MATEPLIKRPRVGWRDPEDAFVIGGDNRRLCWYERPGLLLTATVTMGTYSDLELAAEIKAAMEAAGSENYAVWRDGDLERYYFQMISPSASAIFALGAACASSIFPTLGFTTLPRSGAFIYLGDIPVPDIMYFDFLEPVRSPAFTPDFNERTDNRSYSGRRRSMMPMAFTRKWEAEVRFPNFSHLDDFWTFLQWALKGGAFRWWQHQGAWGMHRWVKVMLENKAEAVGERLPLFKNFTYRIKLLQAGNNDGPIDLEDLQDR